MSTLESHRFAPRYRRMMTGKIHRVRVTGADLNYVGSVTVDADLLEAADILPGQEVDIVDVTNGSRLTTYTIAGERGSGIINVNGAAAHLVHEGDIVILISYSLLSEEEAHVYEPHVVFVGEHNEIVDRSHEAGRIPEEGVARGLHSSGISLAQARAK